MSYREILKRRWRKVKSTSAIEKYWVYWIIKHIVTTEKSNKHHEEYNKYTFVVHEYATKNDVKEAIKFMYNVTPLKVNIIKNPPREMSRMRTKKSSNSIKRDIKKAVVTLWKKWKDFERIEYTTLK